MSELTTNRVIEHFRAFYALNLNNFLQKIKYSSPLKNKGKDYPSKEPFNQDFLPLYDESGKINWDIIRLLMPPDIEKAIKSEYKALYANEIRLCCLLIFDVPTKSILHILNYTPRSIYSTTCSIKQKADVKKINDIFDKIILNMISSEE